MNAQKILAQKHIKDVVSVSPTAMVLDAIRVMAEKGIGAVLVTENSQIKGIFTERDYARKGILKGQKSQKTPVEELMSKNVVTIRPEATLEECMVVMTEGRFRHLPVTTEAGSILGVLSIGDIVNAIISEQKHKIQVLERFMAGSW